MAEAAGEEPVPNILMRMVRRLHLRGYPCLARVYIYALGTWRFELRGNDGGEDGDRNADFFRYSSASGSKTIVPNVHHVSLDDLTTIFITQKKLVRRAFTEEEVQFRRYWAMLCLAIGTRGFYYEFQECGGATLVHAHPKFTFGPPPSWNDSLGPAMALTAAVEGSIQNKLVDLAKGARFPQMFRLLDHFPEFASTARPGGVTRFTLLHHAVFADASEAVLLGLIRHGADLALTNSDGQTPSDLAKARVLHANKVNLLTYLP